MNLTITSLAGGLALALTIQPVINAVVQITDAISPDRSLSVVSLEYDDGVFDQLLEVRGADSLQATWSVEISRNGEYLCGGGGRGVYQNKRQRMTVRDWAGSDVCGDLRSGDRAHATWEWVDDDLDLRSVGVTITIGDHMKGVP